MKRCKRCDTDRPVKDFSKNKSRKDGLNGYCKSCTSSLKKTSYQNNKTERVASVMSRKQAIKDRFWAYKQGLACTDCTLSDPIVLEFDHLGDKTHDVSKMVCDGYSWNRIMLEIQKCEPVCANCHRRRTHFRDMRVRNITINVSELAV